MKLVESFYVKKITIEKNLFFNQYKESLINILNIYYDN